MMTVGNELWERNSSKCRNLVRPLDGGDGSGGGMAMSIPDDVPRHYHHQNFEITNKCVVSVDVGDIVLHSLCAVDNEKFRNLHQVSQIGSFQQHYSTSVTECEMSTARLPRIIFDSLSLFTDRVTTIGRLNLNDHPQIVFGEYL